MVHSIFQVVTFSTQRKIRFLIRRRFCMAEYVKRQHSFRHIGDIPGHLFYGRTCYLTDQ